MKERLWKRVVERDARVIWGLTASDEPYDRWRRRQAVICVVPLLEPQNRRLCEGRQTVDHVKDAPRLAKRAPDDPRHLVAMCEGHNVWYPPSKALRQAERAYLFKYGV